MQPTNPTDAAANDFCATVAQPMNARPTHQAGIAGALAYLVVALVILAVATQLYWFLMSPRGRRPRPYVVRLRRELDVPHE